MVRRVLEPLDLADVMAHRPYWKFLWDSNPPTYYSSPLSSGSPLRSSTAAEAGAGAVSLFAPIRSFVYHPFIRSSSPMRQRGAISMAERSPKLTHWADATRDFTRSATESSCLK
jgi:hypothetical protein